MAEKELDDIISEIKPTKKDITATVCGALFFGFILLLALFEIWGRYSETAAIVSFGFFALWAGQLAATLRFSKKIRTALKT